MDQNVSKELENVLSELQKLGNVVAQKERALNKVNSIYLTQVGSESYELVVNDQVFTLEVGDLNMLLEQMQDAGVFNKLSENSILKS